MTIPPMRRRSDRHLVAMYVWLFMITVAVAITLAIFLHDQRSSDARAYASCERSKLFAPALARAYARYGILTGDALAGYIATIPKSC